MSGQGSYQRRLYFRRCNYDCARRLDGGKVCEMTVQGLHDDFTVCKKAVQDLHDGGTVCETTMQGLHDDFTVCKKAMQDLHSGFTVCEATMQGLHSGFVVITTL